MKSEPDRPIEIASSGASTARSQEIVDALQAVVCDLESFMTSWLGRVQQDLASINVSSDGGALKQRLQIFQEEKTQWEAKRQCELEEIEHKANQLTDAWLKLEAEQRQLLQMQQRQRTPKRESVPPSIPNEPAAEVPREPQNSGEARRSTNAIGSTNRSPGGAMKSLNEAVRQFEQLRREIELTRAST